MQYKCAISPAVQQTQRPLKSYSNAPLLRKTGLKKWVVLPVLLAAACCGHAQRVLGLDDAIALALKNNYDIRLMRNDSAAYATDNAYAYAAFLPRLNGTAGKQWNVNAQKQNLANGTKKDTTGLKSNNLTAALNLNWTLFDGLKMFATKDKLARLVELGELGIKNQVVNTIATVINNYYDIVRQKQQLKAIIEQMSINEERVKLADRKLRVGLGAKPELLQAKVDLNAQKAAVLQQNTLIAQLKEQLNQLTGFTATNYEVSDDIPVNNDLKLEELRNIMVNSNPSLLLAKKNIDVANLSLKENKAALFPTLSFNSAYNFSRTENKAVINSFTPLFNQNKGLNYGFGLTVPILNSFNTRRLIRQSELSIRYQQLLYDQQRSLLDVKLDNAYKNYELGKKSLQLEEDNIALARENVSIELERYRQGVSTYLELREAQKSLEDAYNRLIAARYNLKLAETTLLQLKGDLVK
jgi:outer membrane protein TolC